MAGRPRKHPNDATRIRVGKLTRRARSLESHFYGVCLMNLYRSKGHDPDVKLRLPWVRFSEFENFAGQTIDIKNLSDVDWMDVDRNCLPPHREPLIRAGGKQPARKAQEKQLVRT